MVASNITQCAAAYTVKGIDLTAYASNPAAIPACCPDDPLAHRSSADGIACDTNGNIYAFDWPGRNIGDSFQENIIEMLPELAGIDLSGSSVTVLPSDLFDVKWLHLNMSSNMIASLPPVNDATKLAGLNPDSCDFRNNPNLACADSRLLAKCHFDGAVMPCAKASVPNSEQCLAAYQFKGIDMSAYAANHTAIPPCCSNNPAGHPANTDGITCSPEGDIVAFDWPGKTSVTEIKQSMLQMMPSVIALDLSNNKVNMLPIDFFSTRWVHLDLSNNALTAIPRVFNPSSLANLNTGNCDFTGNHIACADAALLNVCKFDANTPACPALTTEQIEALTAHAAMNGPSIAGAMDAQGWSLSAGAIVGIVFAILLVAAVVPVGYILAKRRRNASGKVHTVYSSFHDDGNNGYGTTSSSTSPGWFKKGKGRAAKVDIPISMDRKPTSKPDSNLATSNVRRFNVDGAYPGMPGYRAADDEMNDTPAFNSSSRRPSAMSTSSELSDEGGAPSARRTLHLNDPIVERASEDLGRDLEESGTAKSSASPYSKPSSSAPSFFSRVFGSSRTQLPTSEDGHAASPDAAIDSAESVEMVTDPRSMYSHQTRHEAEENMVQVRRGGSTSSSGSYTGFTAPGSNAAKRAANRAKKAKLPTVVATRGSSLSNQ